MEILNLGRSFQCVFIDLPGHGASNLGTEALSMSSIAVSIRSLVLEMGIESYDVVGHSMGGYVALELKKIDPSCDKLVLLNSNFWEDSPLKKIDRQRVAELVQTKKDGFIATAIPNLFLKPAAWENDVASLIQEAKGIDADAIAQSSIAMSERTDNFEVVLDHQDEVLIIQGEFDAIVSAELMKERLMELHLELRMLPSGHMAHIEHRDLVQEALLKFLT